MAQQVLPVEHHNVAKPFSLQDHAFRWNAHLDDCRNSGSGSPSKYPFTEPIVFCDENALLTRRQFEDEFIGSRPVTFQNMDHIVAQAAQHSGDFGGNALVDKPAHR